MVLGVLCITSSSIHPLSITGILQSPEGALKAFGTLMNI